MTISASVTARRPTPRRPAGSQPPRRRKCVSGPWVGLAGPRSGSPRGGAAERVGSSPRSEGRRACSPGLVAWEERAQSPEAGGRERREEMRG